MKKWIYQLRGMAIIAVVVCHQQFILHSSELIQMLTLYSVTTFVFLMGYTGFLSCKKNSISICKEGCLIYSLKKMSGVLCEYCVATVCYLIVAGKFTGTQFDVLFSRLFSFSAAGPLYFIRYYIVFTLLAPYIYYLISKATLISKGKSVLYILLFLVCYILGYVAIGTIDCLGGSYLSIYVLGMIFGQCEYPQKINGRMLAPGVIILVLGIVSVHPFYMNRVAGIHDPIGIDVLVPKLQMNPPNISICVYSMGVILLGTILFEMINAKSRGIICSCVVKTLEIWGKYSLDIFIWHMLIQTLLKRYCWIDNIHLKRILYYSAMFFIPVIIKKVYLTVKQDLYDTYSQGGTNGVPR